jgi:hypothetical protein
MENAQIVSCEKIVFRPNDESLPPLPEMNVLFFKHADNEIYTHTAVCTELETDVIGNSVDEARKELGNVLVMHLTSIFQRCKSIKAFEISITLTALNESKQKRELFELYRNYLDKEQKNVEQSMPLTDKEPQYSPLFSNTLYSSEKKSTLRAMV